MQCPTGFALLRLNDSISSYTCAKECHNISITNNIDHNQELLIENMGCKIVRGFLEIHELSEDFCYNYQDLKFREDLTRFFSSIVEIDGFLKITQSPVVKDLGFFTNLKRITGRKTPGNYSLILRENENLNFIWYPHQNVKINHGGSLIESNPELCSTIHHCPNIIDVKIKPNLYTAVLSWKLSTITNLSETRNYEIFIWDPDREEMCDDKR